MTGSRENHYDMLVMFLRTKMSSVQCYVIDITERDDPKELLSRELIRED